MKNGKTMTKWISKCKTKRRSKSGNGSEGEIITKTKKTNKNTIITEINVVKEPK